MEDDGIITKSERDNFGIEYTHLYAPRKLRESTYVRNTANEVQYGTYDLNLLQNQ